MSTITRERLLTIQQWRETYGPGSNVVLPAEEAEELARIALERMDAKAVAWTDSDELRDVKNGGNGYLFAIGGEANKFADPRRQVMLYTAPSAAVVPAELHPDTQKLVIDFCTALAEKLYKAQLKYGYDADWKQDGWPTQCQVHFHQHIAKGDPRDVAAYCAFMWYHGWKTEPAPVSVPDDVMTAIQKVARIRLDLNDFDGDRRGIAESLGEAEEALIEVVNRRAAILNGEKS